MTLMGKDLPPKVQTYRDYFDYIEAGKYEDALDLFTDDFVYRHPLMTDPIRGESDRNEIIELFSGEREEKGGMDVIHDIEKWVVSGRYCAAVVHVTGSKGEDYAVGFLEFENGDIKEYWPGMLKALWVQEKDR